MPIADFQYTEGTIKNPQHTKSTEACFTDTQLVHCPDGRLTPVSNFIASSINLNIGSVNGICRSQWAARRAGSSDLAGSYYYFGTHSNLYTLYKGVGYNITPLKTTAEATLGSNPLSVTSGSDVMTVTYVAHGLAVGNRIRLSGATGTGGVSAAAINKEHIVVTVPTANTFTITVTEATSTTTGGGASVQIFKQIAAGVDYQQLGSGWGYGDPAGWGAGILGIGGFSDGEQAYPRIWSIDSYGQDIVMCPGDYVAGDGQKIYIWDGNRDVAPTVLTDAPTNAQWVFVLNNTVWALCGNQLKSSEFGNPLEWTNNVLVNQFTVTSSARLLSAAKYNDKSAVIFAPEPFLLQDAGGVWDLSELGAEYPIIAPMAFCPYRDGLIWYSPDGNFYFYNGSNVERIVNEQNGEYIRRNINQNAVWTTFMMADQKHDQAWLFFPTGASQNPNEYVIINPRRYRGNVKPSFTLGQLDRTSAQRPAILDTSFYMMNENAPFLHFQAGEANFDWEATTALFYVDGVNRGKLTRLTPDAFYSGEINIEVQIVENPQDTPLIASTDMINAVTPYVTPLAAGKMFAFRFSGDKDFTLGNMKMDIKQMGGGLR